MDIISYSKAKKVERQLDQFSVKVKNLVENGNFANDSDGDGIADGFIAGGENVTEPRVENNTQYWVPESNLYSGSIRTRGSVDFIRNHIYYIRVDITNIRTVYAGSTIIGETLKDGSLTRVYVPSEDATEYLAFYGYETGVESSVSNVIVVDLTATFGAGKEPDTDYFNHILGKLDIWGSSGVVSLGFSENPVMNARELGVYDPENVLPAKNVNEALLDLNDGIVKAERGKNLYNPDKNIEGTITQSPIVQTGQKQQIDTINNTGNYVTQKIKISNNADVTMTDVTVYSVTDLTDAVIVRRNFISRNVTTISSSEIPLKEYYLWVSVRPADINSAQVEMGSEATSYEPYTPVKAVYANGVKLFDFPLEITGETDKKKVYDLAKFELGSQKANELISYLSNNADKANSAEVVTEPIKDSQSITLTALGKQKLILHLHKRAYEVGFGTWNNAYLPNAKDDFSDVRITSDDGTVLPYRIVYKANDFDIVPYDWTRESKHTSATFTDSEGIMYQSDQHLRTSADKGVTWTDLPAFIGMTRPEINLIAQDDTMYFSYANKLYRSEAPYTSYQDVLDLDPSNEYGTVHITGKSLVQHPDGELFCGLYQNPWRINIYKSEDNGFTWQLSADWGDAYQHVHGMYVDEYANPPAIYAGLDKSGGVLKTIDKGVTWVDLRADYPSMPQSTDYGVRYADPSGYRLLTGETPIVGGHSIIKTYDDATFTPVLSDGISVNYILKLSGRMFATGSGSNGFRNGAIYISRDDAETWESVYRTAPLLDLWSANDGYRYMEKISEDEIFVGPQSFSIPPLRIFGSGNYAEVVVDIPDGTGSIMVETGQVYPNEMPIVNDSEFSGDKLVHFELSENSNVIKELVSGEYFEDEFEWTNGGKHLSYFYPYVISPNENNSVLLKSLNGYDVDAQQIDTSDGITISFWARLSNTTRIVLFESVSGDKLEIVDGYQLRLNNVNTISFNFPRVLGSFIKHDILISNDGSINTYTNGLVRGMSGDRGVEILDLLNSSDQMKFLRNVSSDDSDAMQHFVIRKGFIGEDQLLAEYNAGLSDNILPN